MQNAGATHTAETLRNAIGLLTSGPQTAASLVPRGGVHPTFGGAFAVTQNGTPNMSVNVASGIAAVAGTENAKQGAYWVLNDATKNMAIAASDPTNPRIDVVCLKVQDSFYSGVTNAWSIAVVTGTPAGSPVAPALPLNAMKIAQVLVGAAVTSITTANLSDFRPYLAALGGLVRAFGTTERDAMPAYGGFAVWRTDVAGGLLQIHNGTSYVDYQPSFSDFVGELRNSTTVRTSSGTEIIGNTVTFTAVTGARYKVTWNGTYVASVITDVALLRIRHQSGGSLTSGGTQDDIGTQIGGTANKGQQFHRVATISGLTGATTYTVGGTVTRSSGTGNCSISASATDNEYLLVERIT